MSPEQLSVLRILCRDLQVHDDWDYLVVSDGSGGDAGTACGWAVLVFDRSALQWIVLPGASSGETNYHAELLPLVHAVYWIAERKIRAGTTDAPSRTVVVTDNASVAHFGRTVEQIGLSDTAAQHHPWWVAWAAACQRFGVRAEFVHQPRNSTPFAYYCDRLASACRKAFAAAVDPRDSRGLLLDLFHVAPD